MTGHIETITLPSGSLTTQPWKESLNRTIIRAFKREDIQAFPPSWTRLDPNPDIGIDRLAGELGPLGYVTVILVDGQPAGCGGFLPSRGSDWINRASGDSCDAPISEWEICCFCVHRKYRSQGLSRLILEVIISAVREKGGERLASNYSEEETGDFWPRLDFEPVPGATSILKKGFTHTIGMEGLREDIHFQVAVKEL